MSEMDTDDDHYTYSEILNKSGVIMDREIAMNKFHKEIKHLDSFNQLISNMFPDVEEQVTFTDPLIQYVLHKYCPDEKQSFDDWIAHADTGMQKLLLNRSNTNVKREIVRNLRRVALDLDASKEDWDADRDFRTTKLLKELRPGVYSGDPKDERRGIDRRAEELEEHNPLHPLTSAEMAEVADRQKQNVIDIRANQAAQAEQKAKSQIEMEAHEQGRKILTAERAVENEVLERLNTTFLKSARDFQPVVTIENAQDLLIKSGNACNAIISRLQSIVQFGNNVENIKNIRQAIRILLSIAQHSNFKQFLLPENEEEFLDCVVSIAKTIEGATSAITSAVTGGDLDKIKYSAYPISPEYLHAEKYVRDSTSIFNKFDEAIQKYNTTSQSEHEKDVEKYAATQLKFNELRGYDLFNELLKGKTDGELTIGLLNQAMTKTVSRSSRRPRDSQGNVDLFNRFSAVSKKHDDSTYIGLANKEEYYDPVAQIFGKQASNEITEDEMSMIRTLVDFITLTKNEDVQGLKSAHRKSRIVKLYGAEFFDLLFTDALREGVKSTNRLCITTLLQTISKTQRETTNNRAANDLRALLSETLNPQNDFFLNAIPTEKDILKYKTVATIFGEQSDYISPEGEGRQIRDLIDFIESQLKKKGGRRRTKKHVKKHRARTHKKKHNKKTHKRRANKKRRKTMKKRR